MEVPVSIAELDVLSELYSEIYTPELGFEIGSRLNLFDMGILGHFLKSCRHMEHVFQKTNQYRLFVSDGFSFDVYLEGEFITIKLLTPIAAYFQAPQLRQFWSDLEIAVCHNNLKEIVGGELSPVAINMVYKEGHSHKNFLFQQYKCDIAFQARTNIIQYRTVDINRFVPAQNHHVYKSLEAKLKELFKEWSMGAKIYSQKVKNIITNNLGTLELSKDYVARQLNVSSRHLQRLLKQENTAYARILEDIRKEKSLIYLERGLANKEIAVKLGYAETNSFMKSFKKWFGKSTTEFILKKVKKNKNNNHHG